VARTGILILGSLLALVACKSDQAPGTSESPASANAGVAAISGSGGTAGKTVTGSSLPRSPLDCDPRNDAPVECGGVACPTEAEFEHSACFIPCCVTFEGAERCGFHGTSPAFSTDCVLPAVADPSCDDVVQFQGCCEPTQKVCGIIGGFAPGCQTKSNFVTLPAHPKACGEGDSDAGISDRDAG
jgi:hypothetical protein